MDMSDSDTDLFTNNVLAFQNQGTTICAKGPNINANISSLSFRNDMSSILTAPRNLYRSRYAESLCDQRSMYHRGEREMSPMSCHSAAERFQPRNLHSSYYPGGMGSSRSMYNGGGMSSSRSMYNGRGGSPMSVRTVDSNISFSVKDMADAFKKGILNKFDFKIIRDAYNKGRVRKRLKKKRVKGFRRGGDSGEEASNSSVSSDDSQSVRSLRSTYKENMSSCRSTRTDISSIRNTMRESDMVRDCSDNFRQNSFKNKFSTGSRSVIEASQFKPLSVPFIPPRDRLKNGFLLPSQRFNQSVASMSALEKSSRLQSISEDRLLNTTEAESVNRNNNPIQSNQMTDSEQEEIFADTTVMEKKSSSSKRKRTTDNQEHSPVSEQKRNKLSSPQKTNIKSKTPKQPTICKQKPKEFVFAKPQLPIRKPGIVKNIQTNPKPPKNEEKPASNVSGKKSLEKPVEKVIASSKQCEDKLLAREKPIKEQIIASSAQSAAKPSKLLDTIDMPAGKSVQSKSIGKEPSPRLETTEQSTNLSMRPSFIKRKLFSQKVDEVEKNSSSDSVQVDSPQNIYSIIQKEKNKARKLVTTQSCLSRDVFGDDSNLLDLIHRVVPADRMNITTAVNRSEIAPKNTSKPANTNTNKLDVSTTLNAGGGELSDTFTDEEIFTEQNQSQPQNKQTCLQQNKQADAVVHKKPTVTTTFKNSILTVKDKPKNEKMSVNLQNNAENQKVPGNMESKAVNHHNTKNNNRNTMELNVDAKTNNPKVPEKVANHINDKNIVPVTVNLVRLPEIENTSPERNDVAKRNIYKSVRSFWDMDSESDFDLTPRKPPRKANMTIVEETINLVTSNVSSKPIVDHHHIVDKINKNTTNVQKNTIGTKNDDILTEKIKLNSTKAVNEVNKNVKVKQISNKNNINVQKNTIGSKNDDSITEKTKLNSTKVVNEVSKNVKVKQSSNKNSNVQKNTIGSKNDDSLTEKTKFNSTKVDKDVRKIVKGKQILTNADKQDKTTDKRVNTDKIVKNSKSNSNTSMKTTKSTAKAKQTDIRSFNTTIKSKLNNTKTKINNNNNTTTNNNKSVQLNNTMSIRPQRKPKVKKCCNEPTKSAQTVNATSDDSLCKTLRTRQINLSTSQTSTDNKTVKTNKKSKKTVKETNNINNKKQINQDSDLSLTFTPPPTRRLTTMSKKISINLMTQRKSDVSFTLGADQSLNNTMTLRSSSKKNKEVESLEISSSFFFRSKRSPLNKSLAMNRTMRLNRSKMR